MTREELDAQWTEIFEAMHSLDHRTARKLIAAERAFVDRAAVARAIRWVAKEVRSLCVEPNGPQWMLVLADRVERGEIEVP